MIDKIIKWLKDEIYDPYMNYVLIGKIKLSTDIYNMIFQHIEEDVDDPIKKSMIYTKLYGILISNNYIDILEKYKKQFIDNMDIEHITKFINYCQTASTTWEYLINNKLIMDDNYLEGFCYYSNNYPIELYKKIFENEDDTCNIKICKKILNSNDFTDDEKIHIITKMYTPEP